MDISPRATCVALWSSVALVLPVPGFAQTDASIQSMAVRPSSIVARLYVVPADAGVSSGELPANLVVASLYRPLVDAMRARSPTFRRQCERIGRTAGLYVDIQPDPPGNLLRPAAVTQFLRYQYGLMRAHVRIGVSGQATELIAHELEHVVEQLDAIDLAARARYPDSDVRACDCGEALTFETVRAVAIGRRVAAEAAPQ